MNHLAVITPRRCSPDCKRLFCTSCIDVYDVSGIDCEFCREWWDEVMNKHNRAYEERNMERWFKHLASIKKKHVGNGKPSGAFAFTLTKSPKDSLTVSDMLAAVRKVMRQKSCPVKKYAWYYEEKGRDENGDPIHPHIHGMYETESGGRIEQKHFKRAWPIWSEDPDNKMGAGFRGGYHRPVKDNEAYTDYIKKDGGMSESSD